MYSLYRACILYTVLPCSVLCGAIAWYNICVKPKCDRIRCRFCQVSCLGVVRSNQTGFYILRYVLTNIHNFVTVTELCVFFNFAASMILAVQCTDQLILLQGKSFRCNTLNRFIGCVRVILKNHKKSLFARSGLKKMAENHHFSVRVQTNNYQKSSEKYCDDF